jgi:hypothetical protein
MKGGGDPFAFCSAPERWGGFTTYSTLATDTSFLLTEGRSGTAIAYAVATLLVGAAATFAGIWVASVVHGMRSRVVQQGGGA